MVAKARLRPMLGLKAPRIHRVNLSARVAAASPPDTATTDLRSARNTAAQRFRPRGSIERTT